MINREQLLEKLNIGLKVTVEKNKFHWHDEGVLTLKEIQGFSLVWEKENGAKIIEGLGKPYGYDYDGGYILTYHNDRTEGWVVVEKKRILNES